MRESKTKREIFLFIALVGGMGMIGSVEGGAGALSFAGLGLIIWVIWRGRKL